MSHPLVELDRPAARPVEQSSAALPQTSAELDTLLVGLIRGRDRALCDEMAKMRDQVDALDRKLVGLFQKTEAGIASEGSRTRARTNALMVALSVVALGVGSVLLLAKPGLIQTAVDGLLRIVS